MTACSKMGCVPLIYERSDAKITQFGYRPKEKAIPGDGFYALVLPILVQSETLEFGNCEILVSCLQVLRNSQFAVLNEFLIEQSALFEELS